MIAKQLVNFWLDLLVFFTFFLQMTDKTYIQ